MTVEIAVATLGNGLAIAQHMLATHSDPPMAETLEFALVEVDDGRAVFEGTPGRHAYNRPAAFGSPAVKGDVPPAQKRLGHDLEGCRFRPRPKGLPRALGHRRTG